MKNEKLHYINVPFTEKEYQKLMEIKGKATWRQVILLLINNKRINK